jgi:hypothetical protein
MVGPDGTPALESARAVPHVLPDSGDNWMAEKTESPSRDEVLKRMLKMPPKPHVPGKKAKKKVAKVKKKNVAE